MVFYTTVQGDSHRWLDPLKEGGCLGIITSWRSYQAMPCASPCLSCLARFLRDKTFGTTTIIGAVLRFFSLLRGAALQQRGAGMLWADLECKPLAPGVQEVAQDWQPGFFLLVVGKKSGAQSRVKRCLSWYNTLVTGVWFKDGLWQIIEVV